MTVVLFWHNNSLKFFWNNHVKKSITLYYFLFIFDNIFPFLIIYLKLFKYVIRGMLLHGYYNVIYRFLGLANFYTL